MERCDFSSIMSIIRQYISEAENVDQIDLLYCLFDGYISDAAPADFAFDNGQVCRWLNGQAKVSPLILQYYGAPGNGDKLQESIENNILPKLADTGAACQDVYTLFIQDPSVSEQEKAERLKGYDPSDIKGQAAFLTRVLLFALKRPFVKRDTQTRKLLASGSLSPVLMDYIMGNDPPSPCKTFCGREEELEQFHALLVENGKVFVRGIPGIGKSEFAKAYARKYKKEYTNILYLAYSGSLIKDIADMDFSDDLPSEDERARFRKHNRFLRSLKPDTLFIIDNFNTTADQEELLDVLLNYRCHILFTTRSRFEQAATLELREIEDMGKLVELAGKFYSETDANRPLVEQIINTVHRHTLAVELAARLLESSILEPEQLLNKLQEQNVALDDPDKVRSTKDGRSRKATYYEHIHTLFALYRLDEKALTVMRAMSLIPAGGIDRRRFANWLELSDMNTVDSLIETGFIQTPNHHALSLHPIIQEITVADGKPSLTNCKVFLRSIWWLCIRSGDNISYSGLLFQTIENIIRYTEKDDIEYYITFLEDAYPYVDNYSDEPRLLLIIQELERVLQDENVGRPKDRALLLDAKAGIAGNYHRDYEKAVKLDKQAIAGLTIEKQLDAHVMNTLYANLALWQTGIHEYENAARSFTAAMDVAAKYKLPSDRNVVAQTLNWATLMLSTGKAAVALGPVQQQEYGFRLAERTDNSDYADTLRVLGLLYIATKQRQTGVLYLQKSWSIFEEVYASDPAMLQEKAMIFQAIFKALGVSFISELPPAEE